MSAPVIWALDVASETGIAEARVGELPRFYTQRFAHDGDEHEDVFGRALLWLIERLQVDRPDAIYVEAPLSPGTYGQTNATTTVRLIGLWATLAAAVKVKKVRYCRAKVQTVRSAFLGQGNLEGKEAKRRAGEMCRLLGWAPNNHNEADAGAILWWASTKEAPHLAPIITPLMQQRVATTVGGVDFSDMPRGKRVKGRDLPQRRGVRMKSARGFL